jgi:hypothetical protein
MNFESASIDADLLGELRGALQLDLRQDQRELLAAVAGEHVDLARPLADHVRDLAQDEVAGAVPDTCRCTA